MRLLTRLTIRQGMTLIELMVGMVLLVVGILGITVVISKSMRSAKNDQLHWLAAGIAASKIQEIKLNPIQTINLTAVGTTSDWFHDANTVSPYQGCDCGSATLNWSKMTPIVAHKDYPPVTTNFPYSEVVTMGGVDFTCRVCVNRLEGPVGALQSYCPTSTPQATAYQEDYRLVRVQVSWTDPQGKTSTTEAETLIGMQL